MIKTKEFISLKNFENEYHGGCGCCGLQVIKDTYTNLEGKLPNLRTKNIVNLGVTIIPKEIYDQDAKFYEQFHAVKHELTLGDEQIVILLRSTSTGDY